MKQLAQCHALKGTKAWAMVIVKKLFGLLRAKALNHMLIVTRITLYAKRDFF